MSARTVQRTRTNGWQNAIAASAALTTSTRTDDPLLSVVTAPMPTLVIRFGGKSAVSFGIARSEPPALHERPRQPTAAPPETREAQAAPSPSAGEPHVESQAAPAENPPPAGEPTPDPAAQPEAAAAQPPEAADPPPEAQPDAGTDAGSGGTAKPASGSHRIELIIDSLPGHPLTEPIPVVIDPLGDEMFTASMRDLEMAATGNSIGEALLFLKEQIDSTFADLSRRASHLTHDQKTTLQLLHTYIAPQPQPKSRWF